MHYVLDKDGNSVLEPDLLTWARWLETSDRKLAYDEIRVPGHPNTRVSTVFLGIDHAFGSGPPVLWETMVFAKEGWSETRQRRYSSKAAAGSGPRLRGGRGDGAGQNGRMAPQGLTEASRLRP